MDEIQRTSATYERIAADYAAAHAGRQQLKAFARRFSALVIPGGLVYDVGCGPGFDAALLQHHGLRVVGLDISRAQLQVGRNGHGIQCDFVQADMRALPVARSADGLWSCASFLHVPRRLAPATLNELARVLKPAGILFLSVKEGSGEGWSRNSYGHQAPRFFCYWQPEALDAMLNAAGFEIVDRRRKAVEKSSWLSRLARKR